MKKPVESSVGFSDSELEQYVRRGDSLVARVRCWNDEIAQVRFLGVVAVLDVLAGSFAAFVQSTDGEDQFLKDVLQRNFESIPEKHPFKLYSFLNHDDEPSLQIVAESCKIGFEG
jgi:hypothetical protein